MLETWQVVLLTLTNLVLWIPILWTLWHGQFVDATVFFLLFSASTLYHVCQGDKDLCVSSLWEEQASDHIWVMSVIAWLILTFWVFNQDVRFSLFLCILFLAIINVVLVVSSFAFAVFLAWFAILFAALRIFAFGEPLRKYDIALILITALMLGGGFALHLIAGGTDNSKYYWAHSLWHVLAMFGLFLVVLIRDGAFIFSGWETILWHPTAAKSSTTSKKSSRRGGRSKKTTPPNSQSQYHSRYYPPASPHPYGHHQENRYNIV